MTSISDPHQRAAPPPVWAHEAHHIGQAAKNVLEALADIVAAGLEPDVSVREARILAGRTKVDERVNGERLWALRIDLVELLQGADEATIPDDLLWRLNSELIDAELSVRHLLDAMADGRSVALAEEAAGHLKAVVAEAREATATHKVRQALAGHAIGDPVALEGIFPEVASDAGARAPLLRALSARQSEFGGVVEAARGVIYRKADSPALRAITYAAPLAWAALGAVIVLLPAWLGLGFGHGFEDTSGMLARYALVLAGVVIHLLVETTKQLTPNDDRPLPIGRGLDWLHTRWLSVALTFIWAVVAVIGLRFLPNPSTSWQLEYLFAGYAVDSVAGLFLTRFDALAAGGLDAIRGALGASGGSSSPAGAAASPTAGTSASAVKP